jgi:diadenosine tetraphosphate (Ap4A) HIT family hydrolase
MSEIHDDWLENILPCRQRRRKIRKEPIDGRILADCHCLGKWKDHWIMLHRDASVRWFITVPETDATEWHELPAGIHDALVGMATSLSAALKERLSCDKINIAVIGNVVSQFHLHVVGRWKTDPYWPGVVWGRSSVEEEYSASEIEDLRKLCFGALQDGDSRV